MAESIPNPLEHEQKREGTPASKPDTPNAAHSEVYGSTPASRQLAGSDNRPVQPGDQPGDGKSPTGFLEQSMPRPAETAAGRNQQLQEARIAQTPTGFAGHETVLTAGGQRMQGVESYNQKTGERNFYVPNETGGYTPYRFTHNNSLERLDKPGESIPLGTRREVPSGTQGQGGTQPLEGGQRKPPGEPQKPLEQHQTSEPPVQGYRPGDPRPVVQPHPDTYTPPPGGVRPDGFRPDGQKPEGYKPESGRPHDRPIDSRENNPAARPPDSRTQLSNELRNMDPRQRIDLIEKATNQFGQKPDAPKILEGKISVLVPGRVTDGKPGAGGGGGGNLEGQLKVPGGKPGDFHGDGKVGVGVGGGGRGDFGDGRGGKPNDFLHQIDGKLLAQLQNLGRFPDARHAFVDVINRFQDGKLAPGGKDAGIFTLLHGMKPGDVDGLKAWLIDGKRNPFDFKQLDGKVQQDISKIFDSLLGRGGPEKGLSQTMLDMKGLRGSMTDGNLMPGRTLGGEKVTDFRLNVNNLDPVLQALFARLQAKDGTVAATQDRTLTTRLDGKDAADGRHLEGKQLDGKQLDGKQADGKQADGKQLDGRQLDGKQVDPRQAARLGEAVRDALTKFGDVTRTLGERDPSVRVDVEAFKGKPDSKQDSTLETDTKTKPLGDREESTKKTEETKIQDERLADQMKDLLAQQKLREEQEERERLEKEKIEKERIEKEKQDEKKKQADEERLYIALQNDTLNSISEKFFNSSDYAQIIYDRNLAEIMLHSHKNQTYAKLYPRQKIIIPNAAYIDNFNNSMKSHRGINFGRIDYGSAEEELAALFGKNWSGVPGQSPASSASKQDDKPITRRRFSGNSEELSDSARRTNIREAMGLIAQDNKQTPKYNVHLGESLRSIAQKLYKSPTYWRLIAIKNNLSTAVDLRGNPATQLRRGQQLILPDTTEFEAFARDQEDPVVVSLCTDEHGLELPRKRRCGYCYRNTLAMAVNCVSCRSDMDTCVPGEQPKPNGDNQQGISATAAQDVVDQVVSEVQQLQEVTLTNQYQPLNFSPETTDSQEHTVVSHPHPPRDPHPLPHADLSRVELGFEQESDPLWTADKEPVMMSGQARVVESETLEEDCRCLVVTLQLLSGGQWLTVFDYHIRPEEVVIHKYRRLGGRRMMKKTLPAQQSKQMAWNHFPQRLADPLQRVLVFLKRRAGQPALLTSLSSATTGMKNLA